MTAPTTPDTAAASAAVELGLQRHRGLRVAEVVRETPDACSVHFELSREELGWFRYRPGQFVTVRVPLPGGEVARCYSLSSAPGDDRPAITIKRAGPASAWLCDNVAAGWTLDVLPPSGRFTPSSLDHDLLLVAGGSGITPIMSIVRAVMAQGSAQLVVLYANRDAESVIFDRQLRLLSTRHPGRLRVIHWLESDAGLPTAAGLAEVLAPFAERETFLCGPEAFMDAASAALSTLGAPRSRVHRERFVSLIDDPFAEPVELPGPPEQRAPQTLGDAGTPVVTGRTVEIALDGEQHVLPWPEGVRLLDLLVQSGLSAPSSCRSGQCGACTTRVTHGRVAMAVNDVLDDDDLAEGYVLACQAVPLTDTVAVSYD